MAGASADDDYSDMRNPNIPPDGGSSQHALRNWILWHVMHQPHVTQWDPEADGYLRSLASVFSDATTLAFLSRPKAEKAIWNLSFGLGQVVATDTLPTSAKVACITPTPAFFEAVFGSQDRYSAACDMFWDTVCSMGYDDARGEPALGIAMLSALSAQLKIPNRYCQLSALHGFNHLRDPRCRPFIEELQRTSKDPEVLEYAKVAKRFEAL